MLNPSASRPLLSVSPAAGRSPGTGRTDRLGEPYPVAKAEAGTAHRPSPLDGIDLVLAPLSGITDWIFRGICFRFGADMAVSEMISADAVTRRNGPFRPMRHLTETGGALSLQIFGSDPGRMAETAALLAEYRPLTIDLNFGCPVRKVVKGRGGAALLRDIHLLARICQAVVRSSPVPVSAKIRTGWDTCDPTRLTDIARAIEGEGVALLTVHARTRAQAYSGTADWDAITVVKQAVSIPVIGNGDVKGFDDYAAMKNRTGCDAVMIGRAAIGNPWIFAEIKAGLGQASFEPPTPAERIGVLVSQLRRSVQELGEPLGIISIRRVIAAYLRYLPGARALRGRLMTLERLADIENALADYLDLNQG